MIWVGEILLFQGLKKRIQMEIREVYNSPRHHVYLICIFFGYMFL